MKTIYLIRHGKANLKGSDRERILGEEGLVQAKQLAETLNEMTPKIEMLFASPFKRAILSIKPFASQHQLSVREIEDLREIKLSSEPIENLNEARKKMWQDFSCKLPGGESADEAQARGMSVINSVLEQMREDSSVAVVSHGNLLGLVINSFDPAFGFEQWRKMTMPDIFRIDVKNDEEVVTHIGCKNIKTFQIST